MERGTETTYEEVLSDILQRDKNDTTRATAPLRQAEDAILVDTTGISLEDSYALLLETIRKRVNL